MDPFVDGTINNSNNAKHVYKMHDSSAYTLDVLCVNSSNNNNNNEKMDDANQTIGTTATATVAVATATTTPTAAAAATNQKFSTSMRQDSINSDFSPLTDSIQMNTDDRQINSIEFRADDEFSINDNQSNPSDDASDNNSTDNISFVSEDIVENVIVLPNNFLSDDESTNSDDVVYAYRGADFEPAQLNDDANADDETDYLEMDFEPDPASEIEQEPNQSIEPICSHIVATSTPPISFATLSNPLKSETGVGLLSDLNIERTGVHKNWLAPIDGARQNGIYAVSTAATTAAASTATAAAIACPAVSDVAHITSSQLTNNRNNQNGNSTHENGNEHIHTANNNNKLDINDADSIEMESNKSLDTKKMPNNLAATIRNDGDTFPSYYENTVSLSTKKYTGTIPKTSKLQTRPSKSRVTNSDYAIHCNGHRIESQASSSTAHGTLDLRSNSMAKPWTDLDCEKSTASTYCDNSGNSHANPNECSYAKRTVRLLPIEQLISDDTTKSFLIDNRTEQYAPAADGIQSTITVENEVEQTASVTFNSTNCTIQTIVEALEKINISPNMRILTKALRDVHHESHISQMNIPEYLVYASKRCCNYKAIVTAIEQSCDDVDVKYQSNDDQIKTVNIPFRMIASRLPTNGSLNNILTIKNKRFHQMNVLGKIVNMIRRFPDMRDDLMRHESIDIPQYYRSGSICVSKKPPSSNQI